MLYLHHHQKMVQIINYVLNFINLLFHYSARWRENRTIFNTPNPRLMNVSLLRENKLLHGERRGSRMSVRMPSRQPSMASLRPHSPNASMGKFFVNMPYIRIQLDSYFQKFYQIKNKKYA